MNSLEMKTNSRMIEINGNTYQMDFDMEALSQAEQVYYTQFRRNVNISEIISELIQVKSSATMALAYGALVSAGNKIAWKQFSKEIFTYENFDSVMDAVVDAIGDMMVKEKKDSNGTEKN